MTKSKLRFCFSIAPGSVESTTSWAPRRSPSATLPGEVVKSTTCAPNERASFTPMWPNPPRPMMATFWSLPTFQWRSGEYVVMPAHSSGAVAARSAPAGTRSVKASSTTMRSE